MNYKSKLLTGVMALALCGCHNPIFEYEGDCEVTYNLRFVYDKNLDWADAFPTLLNKVELFAFDDQGLFVKEYSLTSPEVFTQGYTMQLDLQPGDYTLVALGALETGLTLDQGFEIPELKPGESTLEDLTCSVRTKSNDQYPVYSDACLPFMYQGNLSVSLPDTRDGSDYFYTMYLTKDTNHIRAIIQKAGGNVTKDEFVLRIAAEDKKIGWNNALLGNTMVTYLPWDIWNTEAIPATSATRQGPYMGIGADFMTGRLTDTMADDTWLYIDNSKTKETIFRIPLIQYELMGKSYYENVYGKPMSDEEFLDRLSEYTLTFFLDENMRLQYTILEILSWRVVINNYDIEDNEN